MTFVDDPVKYGRVSRIPYKDGHGVLLENTGDCGLDFESLEELSFRVSRSDGDAVFAPHVDLLAYDSFEDGTSILDEYQRELAAEVKARLVSALKPADPAKRNEEAAAEFLRSLEESNWMREDRSSLLFNRVLLACMEGDKELAEFVARHLDSIFAESTIEAKFVAALGCAAENTETIAMMIDLGRQRMEKRTAPTDRACDDDEFLNLIKKAAGQDPERVAQNAKIFRLSEEAAHEFAKELIGWPRGAAGVAKYFRRFGIRTLERRLSLLMSCISADVENAVRYYDNFRIPGCQHLPQIAEAIIQACVRSRKDLSTIEIHRSDPYIAGDDRQQNDRRRRRVQPVREPRTPRDLTPREQRLQRAINDINDDRDIPE